MNRLEIAGRTAMITGGAQGIGLGLARALHSRGANLALVDIDGAAAERAAAGFGAERAIGIAADVTDAGAMQAAVASARERFGALDIVVANAGIAPRPAPTRQMDAGEFERVVEVDLLGVYRTVRAGLEEVVARGGHIVVVASVYAFVNGMLNAPYAVAKAGVEQLGRALRVELASAGVGVTVAYFGFVDTQMVRDALDQPNSGQDAGELLPAFVMRRITPEQAGEAVAVAIERRRGRVIAPRWWTAASVLRGVLGPATDLVAARSRRIARVLEEAGRG